LALIPPFLPPKGLVYATAIPPLLSPLLNILFVTLSLPLISYLLLAAPQAPIVPRLRPTPSSPGPHRKATSLDLPSTVRLEAPAPKQQLPRFLLAGQVCALFSSLFNVCGLAIADGPVAANLALQTIDSTLFAACIIFVMRASSRKYLIRFQTLFDSFTVC